MKKMTHKKSLIWTCEEKNWNKILTCEKKLEKLKCVGLFGGQRQCSIWWYEEVTTWNCLVAHHIYIYHAKTPPILTSIYHCYN
jgi:hypothetical protein